MINIAIDLGAFNKDLEARLHEVLAKIDVRTILDEAGAALLNRQRDRFLRQVDPDEVPWWPSDRATMRAKTGRDGGTLFDTGTLFHSIQLHETGPNDREISTDVPYAHFHQFGTTQPHSLRPFLGFSEEDVTIFEKIVSSHLRDL
jgi:phage virion morphogenesis protein